MHVFDPTLAKALALSLLLHALLLAAGGRLYNPARADNASHAAQLEVMLQTSGAVTQQPQLFLQEDPPPPRELPAERRSTPTRHAVDAARAAPAADAGLVLAGEAMQHANAQLARELLYPPEAIARGLEGQALVLLFLDASGNAVAARLEASSGHALLDEAAVRAARTLRALPDSAPREALLPVRFRLR